MKVRLVDRGSGEERGWLEFEGPIMRIPASLVFLNVTTVGAFCGFEPLEPPTRIEFL
jgi:hypothetical protein